MLQVDNIVKEDIFIAYCKVHTAGIIPPKFVYFVCQPTGDKIF